MFTVMPQHTKSHFLTMKTYLTNETNSDSDSDCSKYFLGFHGFIDSTAEEVIGNRVRERGRVTRSKGTQAGVEPGSTAARPKPLPLNQLRLTQMPILKIK